MDNNTTTEAVKRPQARAFSIRDTFGLPGVNAQAKIPGLEPGLPGVPPLDANYVFQEERLRQFVMFWIGGFKALMIEGDPAAGKTSFVEQIHARLNWPLYKVSCSPTTESYSLIGQLLPNSDGKLVWHDGPVIKACREGGSVLLDEYNTLDPGASTGLNMLLEGYSLTIPETGETITPATTTRFFATQNAVDSKTLVAGRNVQDVANEDRWSYMQVDYLDEALERELVKKALTTQVRPELAEQVATLCVGVATKVRESFRNDVPDIDKPLSTRAVVRWAKYTVMYTPIMSAKNLSGAHYAIRQALRMSPTMARAVNYVITLVAGYDENMR